MLCEGGFMECAMAMFHVTTLLSTIATLHIITDYHKISLRSSKIVSRNIPPATITLHPSYLIFLPSPLSIRLVSISARTQKDKVPYSTRKTDMFISKLTRRKKVSSSSSIHTTWEKQIRKGVFVRKSIDSRADGSNAMR